MIETKSIETSAERYRRIKAERAAGQELFDFTSPSGMEWKLRKLDLSTYLLNGAIPQQMASRLASASKATGGDNIEAFKSLEWKDQAKAINFASSIVRYCAVVPRIVESPEGPDEIGYEDVEADDYAAIVKWAMPQGGVEGDSLEAFPEQ